MHISRVKDGESGFLHFHSAASAAHKANEQADTANPLMQKLTPERIRHTLCVKKCDPYKDITSVINNLTAIQEKKKGYYATSAIEQERMPSIREEEESLMVNIRSYASSISAHALAMVVILTQPSHFSIGHIDPCVQSILEYARDHFNRSDRINFVENQLVRHGYTIHKQGVTDIVEWLPKSIDRMDTAYDARGDNIIEILHCILKSTHAAIEKIDIDYFELDDAFFDRDKFTLIHHQPYAASVVANQTYEGFDNAQKLIKGLSHDTPIESLKEAHESTKKAKNAAKTAQEAYRYFAEYFNQFTPTINKMLHSCRALFRPSIQKILNHCDEYLPIIQPTIDDDTVDLGVDLKAIQDALDRLHRDIWIAYQKLQYAEQSLHKAIQESKQAYQYYKLSYRQYNNVVHEMNSKLYTGQYTNDTISK
ncbi:hypothetical protein [Cardinium endosymbiont of Sogatella furcifera]|uniref:hypothetical protein n=1 Tax=Cardinium endosymbiont of Sogatella furcifera TaxID=650378 RepID=UPI0013B36D7E|nr:hypothetical protein [Cardinium endosymbiont of Sogatella furcifera]